MYAALRACNSQRRTAITLVEVLVALGVVGLLLALMFPAVASSREASRRVNCQNHLKQLAIASHAFHDVNGMLPMQNFVVVPVRYSGPPGAVSAWGQLLPYLEQSALHARIDFNEIGEGNDREPPTSALNPEMLTEHLPLLVCPSDRFSRGATNYRACLGSASGPPYRAGVGAYYSLGRYRQIATFSMIKDGLSQTALCSERLIGDFNPNSVDAARDVYYLEGHSFSDPDVVRRLCGSDLITTENPHYSFGGVTWFFNGFGWVWYNHVDTPNSRIADCCDGGPSASSGKYTARSLHPGGVNLVLADGSGRFVSDAIDLKVWRALGTRDGNDSVSE